jgi:hypothetical protein
MQPIRKNIINKWLKLYFYNYDSYYFSLQQDENFCKNISLYFKSSNKFNQINLVQKHGWAIQYIKNPSEKVQLAAVNQNGVSIHYIINKGIVPSEKVQITAVNQNGGAIYYIENPSEKVQLAAVNQNYDYIFYIKTPYPSVIELYEKLSGKKYLKK